MPNDAEIFLEHLQGELGDKDAIHSVDSSDNGPRVSVFVYRDIPERGMITGVSYGLSLCEFPAWKLARPEMIVSVNSTNIEWPLAAATFVANFRGQKTFQYGDIFTTDRPLASDTAMDGFLVFAQSILDNASVQLTKYKLHFNQFYPIYRDEAPSTNKLGWKHFESQGFRHL